MDPNIVKLSSTYPPAPMIYINSFTNENIKNGMAPAPPLIIQDNYSCFGKPIDPNDVLIRSLESQGIQRVYTSNDHKKELKKLNHSILMNYLDLLDILVKSPNTIGKSGRTLREEKLDELDLLFINMHHLINELRPHQARDNLKSILEMQKQQRLEITMKFEKHLIKIIDLLKLSIQSIKCIDNKELNNFLNELNLLIDSSKTLLTSSPQTVTKNDNDNKLDVCMSSVDNNFNNINKEMLNQNYKDEVLCDIVDDFLKNNF